MSKIEWRNYSKIRDALLDMGGVIFGGAVRDEILHNMCAKKFYEEQQQYYKHHPDGKNKKEYEYDNRSISRNTIDRLIIPNDIDVMFDINKVNEIIKYFTKFYNTKICKTTDLAYFKKDFPKNMCTLFKIEVLKKFNEKYYLVKIDLLGMNNVDNEDPITLFNSFPLNYDFDINSMFWSKNEGIYSKELFSSPRKTIHNSVLFYELYTNINKKIANMTPEFLWSNLSDLDTSNYKHSRIMKLKNKGWKIVINFNIYNFHSSNHLTQDDTCIICLKNKNDFNHCVNFKKCNCKSVMCLECIKKEYKKLNKCPTCREIILEQEDCNKYAKNEINFYEKYVME